jgi:hypothetical protein
MEVRIMKMVIMKMMNGIGIVKKGNVKVRGFKKEKMLRKRVGEVELKRW